MLKTQIQYGLFSSNRENLFHKFPQICKLETRHVVNIGKITLQNLLLCRSFAHYIAEAKKSQQILSLQNAKFFALILDGSTDCANVGNELIWFDKDGHGERVCIKTNYLKIRKLPTTSTADILVCLRKFCRCWG